jgi:hypothetical protein
MPTLGFAENDPPTDDYYSGDGRYKPQRDLELGVFLALYSGTMSKCMLIILFLTHLQAFGGWEYQLLVLCSCRVVSVSRS